jgi:hypothetical protein
MKIVEIPGGVKVITPESKADKRKLADMITSGKVDAGMDITAQLKIMQQEPVTEGWVTIRGNHVLIGDDGVITKGPSELVGKHISTIKSSEKSC